MRFDRLNNWTGWAVWALATLVYFLTVEPTASFWDCGEFIASAYKLEVGHPPGAPFFMLLARFLMIPMGPDTAALAANMLSVLSSSFTILFLFWSITHLAKRLSGEQDPQGGTLVAVLGSGVVGALAYTFSDSFWFSAVEGEVYALSSLFTALVFWAILKWENVADRPDSTKWIILIAYLMGLVHRGAPAQPVGHPGHRHGVLFPQLRVLVEGPRHHWGGVHRFARVCARGAHQGCGSVGGQL